MPARSIHSIIQNRQIVTSSSRTTVSEAARLMKQRRIGAVLVVDEDRLVGIFTERDALYRVLAEGRDPKTTHIGHVMTAHPQCITADKPFGHALLLMYENGYRHVPVVEQGRPVGMVSARDALGPELQQFEGELERREHIKEILG
jgi:CBS domain-containing protein